MKNESLTTLEKIKLLEINNKVLSMKAEAYKRQLELTQLWVDIKKITDDATKLAQDIVLAHGILDGVIGYDFKIQRVKESD